jgi:hypothetical protein
VACRPDPSCRASRWTDAFGEVTCLVHGTVAFCARAGDAPLDPVVRHGRKLGRSYSEREAQTWDTWREGDPVPDPGTRPSRAAERNPIPRGLIERYKAENGMTWDELAVQCQRSARYVLQWSLDCAAPVVTPGLRAILEWGERNP